MLVIVGHGPSLLARKLGSWLDQQTVVRLKNNPVPGREYVGTRTDYCCSTHPAFRIKGPEFWCYPDNIHKPAIPEAIEKCNNMGEKFMLRICNRERWDAFYAQYNPTCKPSTGFRAICCAVEFLNPPEIGLVGFDRLFGSTDSHKWYHGPEGGRLRPWVHDSAAEWRAVQDLVKVVNLATEESYGGVLRVRPGDGDQDRLRV